MNELTIQEIQTRMRSGELNAVSLAESYLERIEMIDKAGPSLNAVIELNPDALTLAEALDKELGTIGPRGPLHGVPILIKDNLDTADQMTTTAGSLALQGNMAAQELYCGGQIAKSRRHHPGQDEPERVGQLPIVTIHQRLVQPRRSDPQPLRAGSQPLRFQSPARQWPWPPTCARSP